ncbi:hypothetical protein DY000_02021132 [Brassica cretica]|uniref:Uncharacterized protein n=1 Tax=Brassica cretica TaxID=69181 RepID=A0ABQ7EHS7_BRACR|nr:hypothetical protein DY000_02021132 [Brassica cretica]
MVYEEDQSHLDQQPNSDNSASDLWFKEQWLRKNIPFRRKLQDKAVTKDITFKVEMADPFAALDEAKDI